ASLGPDDALVVCRSVLPYELELHLHAVSRDHDLLEVRLSGPLEGYARWCLHPGPSQGTRLEFEQEVVVRGGLAWASLVLRPVLAWNHSVMMRGRARGLERRLVKRPIG